MKSLSLDSPECGELRRRPGRDAPTAHASRVLCTNTVNEASADADAKYLHKQTYKNFFLISQITLFFYRMNMCIYTYICNMTDSRKGQIIIEYEYGYIFSDGMYLINTGNMKN